MPKRGFNNYEHAKEYAEVNLSSIQTAIDSKRLSAAKSIDVAALIEAGVLKYARDGLSLLGKGALKTKVTLVVSRASQAAIKAVEAAGRQGRGYSREGKQASQAEGRTRRQAQVNLPDLEHNSKGSMTCVEYCLDPFALKAHKFTVLQ